MDTLTMVVVRHGDCAERPAAGGYPEGDVKKTLPMVKPGLRKPRVAWSVEWPGRC